MSSVSIACTTSAVSPRRILDATLWVMLRQRLASSVAALLVLLGGGCNSTGGGAVDPGPDARTVSAQFVGAQVYGPLMITTEHVTVPFSATDASNTLLVAVTVEDGWISEVRADQGRSIDYGYATVFDRTCHRSSRTWAVRPRTDSIAPTTAITLYGLAGTTMTMAVMEFSGLGRTIGSVGSWKDSSSSVLPRIPASPGEVVISTLATCDTVALAPSSDFTLLDLRGGVGTAYRVADQPGVYGAEWMVDGQRWEAITVGYR